MKTMYLGITSGFLMASMLFGSENAPGVTDKEIKVGNTIPYSGPVSSYGAIGINCKAFFEKVNSEGGVNGRKIVFISKDDAYSPQKTLEQTRRLVEEENVMCIFGSLGTPTSTAIRPYLNEMKVPQVFVMSGASKWNDPQAFPWTIGWQPTYHLEGKAYGLYILKNYPKAKVGVLYQNDDYGKDYLNGLKDGLGDKADAMIVKVETYNVTDPSIDSQILNLKSSGADIFIDITTSKFSVQAIKKKSELDWKAVHFLNNVSANIEVVFRPAGIDHTKGIITALYMKSVSDPKWRDTPEVKEYFAFMKKYNPKAKASDYNNYYAYTITQTFVALLKQCGDNLTRENVMKQAAHLDMQLPLLIPGIKVQTSPTDYAPIKRMMLVKFNGESFDDLGFAD